MEDTGFLETNEQSNSIPFLKLEGTSIGVPLCAINSKERQLCRPLSRKLRRKWIQQCGYTQIGHDKNQGLQYIFYTNSKQQQHHDLWLTWQKWVLFTVNLDIRPQNSAFYFNSDITRSIDPRVLVEFFVPAIPLDICISLDIGIVFLVAPDCAYLLVKIRFFAAKRALSKLEGDFPMISSCSRGFLIPTRKVSIIPY